MSCPVLLTKAGLDETLESYLGVGADARFWEGELKGKTHVVRIRAALPRSSTRSTWGPVDFGVCCRNGLGKGLTLHRLYYKQETMMYIVAAPRKGPVA